MGRLWLVRLGRYGQHESYALSENALTIDFGLRGNVSHLTTRDAIVAEMAQLHPDDKPNKHKNFSAQINQFLNVAQTGDLVVSPMKTTSTVAIGRFAGSSQPNSEGMVTRPVEWLKTDLPREAFHQDLLYSFGAFMTVCEIKRNDAVRRIEAVIKTGRDPGDGSEVAGTDRSSKADQVPSDGASGNASQQVNLQELAQDQIERRIASVFSGHDFTRLVSAILTAQGYRVRTSSPGADKGVDAVAGSGPLGLEAPRIVVQVKSGDVVVDQPTLQALIGSIQDTQADYGLIVSWKGYTEAVRRRVNDLFFRVRLWGREELLSNLFAVYDSLPEDIKAELPLKRTWTLVLDEAADLG